MRALTHAALAVVTLMAVSNAVEAQTVDVLNAQKVNDYVYLVAEPFGKDGKNSFTYARDEHGGRDKRRLLGPVVTLAGYRPAGVNVVLRFLNPIGYTWTTSEAVTDDPSAVAVRQFLKSLNEFMGVLGGKTDATPAVTTPTTSTVASSASAPATTKASAKPTEEEATKQAAKGSTQVMKMVLTADSIIKTKPGKADQVTKLIKEVQVQVPVPVMYAPALRDWSDRLVERSSCLLDATEAKNMVDGVGRADQQIYGTVKNTPEGVRSAESFRVSIVAVIKELKSAGTIKDLEAATKHAADTSDALTSANKAARASLGGAKGPDVWGDGPGCQNFGIHTAATLEMFQAEAGKVLDAREKLITDLVALNSSVTKMLLPSMHADGDQEYFMIGNVQIEPGKVKDVTVTVQDRSVEFRDGAIQISDGAETKSTFHVLEHQAMLFEFAPGLVYVDIPYPKYAVVQDSLHRSVVGLAGDDKQIGSAVAMLNVTPNIHWGGISRLIGQIGVGTGKQFPILLFGAGIRLSDSSAVTLTAGGAMAFRSELSTLTLGSPAATIGDIEKDLHYKLSAPRFYIGIQRGLQ